MEQQLNEFSCKTQKLSQPIHPLQLKGFTTEYILLEVVSELKKWFSILKQVLIYGSNLLPHAFKELKYPVTAKPLLASVTQILKISQVFNGNGLKELEPICESWLSSF